MQIIASQFKKICIFCFTLITDATAAITKYINISNIIPIPRDKWKFTRRPAVNPARAKRIMLRFERTKCAMKSRYIVMRSSNGAR